MKRKRRVFRVYLHVSDAWDEIAVARTRRALDRIMSSAYVCRAARTAFGLERLPVGTYTAEIVVNGRTGVQLRGGHGTDRSLRGLWQVAAWQLSGMDREDGRVVLCTHRAKRLGIVDGKQLGPEIREHAPGGFEETELGQRIQRPQRVVEQLALVKNTRLAWTLDQLVAQNLLPKRVDLLGA